MFIEVMDINECADKLKEKIKQSKDFKLFEIDNRLKGKTKTSDIVFKILVANTIAELQLPISFDIAQN